MWLGSEMAEGVELTQARQYSELRSQTIKNRSKELQGVTGRLANSPDFMATPKLLPAGWAELLVTGPHMPYEAAVAIDVTPRQEGAGS